MKKLVRTPLSSTRTYNEAGKEGEVNRDNEIRIADRWDPSRPKACQIMVDFDQAENKQRLLRVLTAFC